MILTEEEAKTKWCPAVRLTDGTMMYFDNRGRQFGGDSGHSGVEASTCIASGCMAWRHLVGNTGKGFCGLAGKP